MTTTQYRYVLDAFGNPKTEDDLMTWAVWYEQACENDHLTVSKTHVGDATVSTIFLALDKNFGRGGTPILWETMILGGEHDECCWRYTSRGAAQLHHALLADALAKRKPLPEPKEG
jgi:hypothetical protein